MMDVPAVNVAPAPRAIIDAIPNPMLVIDEDGRICLANGAAAG